jgi:hypothetical protein
VNNGDVTVVHFAVFLKPHPASPARRRGDSILRIERAERGRIPLDACLLEPAGFISLSYSIGEAR